MSRMNSFFKKMAHDVYWGYGDTDHPDCPKCSSTMEFHGGDLAHGDGYWECHSCGFSFTEADLSDYEV